MEAQLGFNKVYQQYPGVDMFSRIIVANDTIFAVGVAYDSTEVPSPQQVLMTKTDTFGNIIKTKLYRDSLDEFLTMSFLFGNILHTSKDFIAFPVFVFGRNAYQIIQINTALEVQSIFEYPIGDNKNEFYEQLLEMPDGGFMIAGSAQRSNLKQDGFVRRVDKHGNLLWEKYYGELTKDEIITCISQTDENQFIIGGSVGPDFNNSSIIKAGIWVIDSNGTVINTWIGPQSPDFLVIRGMLTTPDGGVIAHGRTYWGEGPWGSKVQICLMKFNESLQYEWFKHIGPSSSNYNGVYDMTATPDGHYLLAGQRTSYGDFSMPSDDWGGWLYKFSAQGDSLWSRADNAPPGMNATGEYAYGGVGLLSSGSVVAGGKGDIDDKFVGWIVKVSANGCMDSLDCLISAVESVEEMGEIEVFPNPANQTLQITRRAGEKSAQLRIIGLTGTLEEYTIPQGQTITVFSTIHLPNGLYTVVMMDEGKVVARQKVVIIH
ncbi:MAG: T9SS type A sorting domain-containing protein [Chitinophagales bacterium]|nr:T9SS type A sorting domain-containing protein [Chitinophagales bacterium]